MIGWNVNLTWWYKSNYELELDKNTIRVVKKTAILIVTDDSCYYCLLWFIQYVLLTLLIKKLSSELFKLNLTILSSNHVYYPSVKLSLSLALSQRHIDSDANQKAVRTQDYCLNVHYNWTDK